MGFIQMNTVFIMSVRIGQIEEMTQRIKKIIFSLGLFAVFTRQNHNIVNYTTGLQV